MRMWMTVAFVAACGSKKTEQAPAPAPAPAPATTPAPAKTPAPARAKLPPPTKEQRAEYRKRMKTGWARQKDLKWADAVPEFEAALVAMPADQRALTELGWSAMNAGDFVKARKADQEAILVSVDKKLEAAGLYNLGLVQQKTGDTDGARKSFTASLALRANKTVEDALAGLGKAAEAAEAPCDLAKPCPCVIDAAFGELARDDATCAPSEVASPIPGFHVYRASQTFHGWDADMLLDEHGGVVGQIGGGDLHGRHDSDFKLDAADVKTIAGHRVLRLETTDAEQTTLVDEGDDEDMGFDTYTTKAVTICLLGDAKTPTTCPLRDVPILEEFDHAPPKGPQHTTTTTADLTLADDGTATVKLKTGASDPRLDRVLGPHKLW
jgi:hypothetical protein